MASKMETAVLDAMKAASPLDFDKATAIADRFGLKARSVVASAIRNGIAYNKKAKVNKAGLPVEAKDDLVERIAENLQLDLSALEGLDKASKSALVAVATVTDLLRLRLAELEKIAEDAGY
jgi:hypothetical protein